MSSVIGYSAELVDREDPGIGQELIRVSYADGRSEELRLHEYERVYAIPGLYEQIVQGRLGCRSPDQIASMLADGANEAGWERDTVRVIDLAAGNGVSGEALKARGLTPVLGTDIIPEARAAALRDRPEVYGRYLTLDLLALSPEQEAAVRSLRANALACVAPVGSGPAQLPASALTAAARLLSDDALVAYMHDPMFGDEDEVSAELWAAELGSELRAELLERRRYLHRYTVSGRPYEMEGVVWRLQAQ